MRAAWGLGLILAVLVGPAAAQDISEDTSWYAIIAEGGDWVGHGSRTITPRPDGRDIAEVQELRFQEAGSPETVVTEQTTTRQNREGRTLSIDQLTRTGASSTQIEARIGAAEAHILRRTQSGLHETRVPLPRDVRFDAGAGLLAAWNPVMVPRLEFRNFSLDAMVVERVTIERLAGAAPTSGGGIVVLRKRFDGGQLRSVARLTLDASRHLIAASQPMFGTSMTIRPVSREEASLSRPPYRLLRDSMIKSPFRIPPSAMQAHIRYRFTFRDGIEFAPPETGEQRVTAGSGETTLDICEDCGAGLPSDKAYLADALRPTAWLQSDHPRLKAIVASVARLRLSNTRKMELLTDTARGLMGRVDFVGHYSALETIQRGAGDCTEAAVLLAALGRAAGIPTRVVNGLAYSRERYHGVSNAFMPHSWTLAWTDGKWRSFDSALDRFDSTHIALTIGDGDARSIASASQLAGLLRWEGMSEVRSPPAS